MPSCAPSPLVGRKALEAVASPARLEILSILGDGPATTRELADRLGRSRQSLYYHLGLLERAGLVTAEEQGEARERQYRLRHERLAVAGRRGARADHAAAIKAINAILRLTGREAAAAVRDPSTRFEGAEREMIGFRGKARLTGAELRRVNRLIDELDALFRTARGRAVGRPLYALTLVLTPAREAGDADSRAAGTS